MSLRSLDLGRRGFGEVEALQESLRERVLAGEPNAETLLVVEHDPVVTMGRRRAVDGALLVSASELAARGIARHETSRGGEATYHGPGQLVAYPVVTLRRGVVAHVTALGEAAVEVAQSLEIDAVFDRARPGVWVGPRKLASIGVHVRRRVAVHGIALNVTSEAVAPFSLIVPCGMASVSMTSLQQEAGRSLDLAEVREAFTRALLRRLELHG
jgi:lipoate-protein ligase B